MLRHFECSNPLNRWEWLLESAAANQVAAASQVSPTTGWLAAAGESAAVFTLLPLVLDFILEPRVKVWKGDLFSSDEMIQQEKKKRFLPAGQPVVLFSAALPR